jgi:hypothetical protein
MRNLLLLLLLCPLLAIGQQKSSDEDQIKAVILKTFSAMKAVDTVALKSCFTTNALLNVSQLRPEGTIVREVPISKFVQSVLSRKQGDMDERVLSWGPILIDHEIATAWVPYEFYLNGKFSHKGVDVFLFVKTGNEFKIQTLLYNMQK